MIRHSLRTTSFLTVVTLSLSHAAAQVPVGQDTIVIPGDTFHGRLNAGLMETTINGDTTPTGARANPNRVYALNQGQYYHQLAPIYCYNPTGMLTICGIPSPYGTTKPVILITPVPPSTQEGTNTVYGSITCDGIHYQAQQLTGTFNAELFYCGTANKRPQRLIINNCLFEFCNIDLFDCTNETGAIGGWPYGASFLITNSYFRNMFYPGQWWGSRVFQCKHPIDTLWVENVTTTTAGLTFLQQNELTDFAYINHCTFVNNKKYWLLSGYHRYLFITNNIFMNQNWVGEDTNVTNSGQDPDKVYQSTIFIDTNNASNGLVVQPKYYMGDQSHFSPLLNFSHMRVYVSDNVNYYDTLLISGYYNSSKYVLPSLGTIPSYLNWAGAGSGPWRIYNIPCEWMNTRTKGIFADWSPPGGGFVEKRTSTANPHTVTPSIPDASVIDSMAVWNQNQWGDPRWPLPYSGLTGILKTKYIYGDYDPTTLPGIVNNVKTDQDTMDGAGITKFTDLTENFSQSTIISAIDGLPVGALMWDDVKFAAFNSQHDYQLVTAMYEQEGSMPVGVEPHSSGPGVYSLSQNYPNPFNPTTTIRYSLAQRSHVLLRVFNSLGQIVSTLVNEEEESGERSVSFDGSNLASGLYIYRLQAGSFVQARKLLLLK